MIRRAFLMALFGAGLLCAAHVQTDFDPGKSFASYRTFAFLPQGEIRHRGALSDSLTRNRVQSAIVRQLTGKGLREVGYREHPDLIVRYWTGVRERREVYTSGPAYWGPYGPFWGGYWGPRYRTVMRYNEQSLFVDLIDARGRDLAWRAAMADTMPKPKDAEKKYNDWMAKAFKTFPPSEKDIRKMTEWRRKNGVG